jgi:type I restriction enzyme S subunit
VRDLPPGWVKSTVGDVVDRVVVGYVGPAKRHYVAGSVPFLLGKNVRAGQLDLSDLERVNDAFQARERKSQLNARDVVVIRIGRSGEAAVVPDTLGPANCGGLVIAKQPRGVTPEFLAWYLNSPEGLRASRAEARGMTRQTLNTRKIEAADVPVPPYSEQLRITEKLESLLVRVNVCRERLDRVPEILKRFRESVLEAAVSGKLTEEWRASAHVDITGLQLARDVRARHGSSKQRGSAPNKYTEVDEIREVPESWGWVSGAEVVDPSADIIYGIVQPGPKLNEGVPYVRGMDIENGKILTQQLLKTSDAIAKRYERASLRGGDVLLGIIRATKVAIVPDELAGANITQGTARFRPSSAIRTSYLARVLEAPMTQKWLHDCYRGIDMPGLNLADVRRVPIPLPSLEEQDETIRRVDTLFTLGDHLEHLYETGATSVQTLTPSVLAKAFRGELVPQDPNDEPAEKLLQRIRHLQPAQVRSNPDSKLGRRLLKQRPPKRLKRSGSRRQ